MVTAKQEPVFFGRRLAWLGKSYKRHIHDTVLIHEWNPRIVSFWRDWAVCRWRQIPVVVWGHAWGKGGPRGFMFHLRHWMASCADGVICYTEAQAELTHRMHTEMPVIAAPNACMSRADGGVTGDEVLRKAVIYVGRIVSEKKVDLLIEGFSSACANCPEFDARLVIVGDGPTDSDFFRTLRQKVASANADGVVKFVGAVSDPRPWYVMADIVINGRVDPEPFGLTVVEAMLMERPVIAYRAGGPGETIIDGETGWLIDDCSTDAYREGIRRALADKPRWGQMGRVAREHASSRFSVSCMVSRYVEYVERDRRVKK